MQITNGVCLICGNEANTAPHQRRDGNFINCEQCGRYSIGDYTMDYLNTIDEKKFRACAYFYFMHYRNKNKPYYIVKEKLDSTEDVFQVTVDEILNLYPKNISERIDKILINMVELNNGVGEKFYVDKNEGKMVPFYFLTSNKYYDELIYIIKLLSNLSLIESAGWTSSGTYYRIDFNGWEKIAELQKQFKTRQQGFVAMWFDPSMEEIRDAIKEVIEETGYKNMIIDEKHHNNQIVPEILYEIKNSDFLIADLTNNRNGVYYEAGYALGLGKPVILLTNNERIKEDKENAPHFDVAQTNQIRYNDIADLKIQLFNRITASIGNLKNPSAKLKK